MWKCWQDGWGAENAHWAEVPCLPLVLMQVCVRVTVNPWLLLQPVSVAPKLISHVHTNNHAHTGHQAMNPFTRVKQKVFAIVQTRKPVHKPCATKELLFNHTVTQQYSSYIWKEKKKEKKNILAAYWALLFCRTTIPVTTSPPITTLQVKGYIKHLQEIIQIKIFEALINSNK